MQDTVCGADQLRIEAEFRAVRDWQGSARLRFGVALRRAGIRARYVGQYGVDPVYRTGAGQFLSLDAVTGRVSMLVGEMPKLAP